MTFEEFKTNAIADAKPYSAVDIEKNWKAWLSASERPRGNNMTISENLQHRISMQTTHTEPRWMQVRRITSRYPSNNTMSQDIVDARADRI
jgi:hypothetical protein